MDRRDSDVAERSALQRNDLCAWLSHPSSLSIIGTGHFNDGPVADRWTCGPCRGMAVELNATRSAANPAPRTPRPRRGPARGRRAACAAATGRSRRRSNPAGRTDRRLQREDHAQRRGLRGDVAIRWDDELREERQEEEHDLGVDRVGEHALEEQPGERVLDLGRVADLRAAAAAQGLDAQPDQVETAGDLERGEGHGRCGDQRAHTDGGEHRVAQAAQRATQTEGHAVTAALADTHAQHHQVVRTGRGGDEQRGQQEAEELGGGQQHGAA
ncbi:hypothetical protein Ddc_22486 [Ditylenchus destructor]|nr:hypothetical protein Ddc_22486 [Ditylenchus destructor]